jgi:hypothetical protein
MDLAVRRGAGGARRRRRSAKILVRLAWARRVDCCADRASGDTGGTADQGEAGWQNQKKSGALHFVLSALLGGQRIEVMKAKPVAMAAHQ